MCLGYGAGRVCQICGSDIRVCVLPVVMWVQVCYYNEINSLYITLVAGSRLFGVEHQKVERVCAGRPSESSGFNHCY